MKALLPFLIMLNRVNLPFPSSVVHRDEICQSHLPLEDRSFRIYISSFPVNAFFPSRVKLQLLSVAFERAKRALSAPRQEFNARQSLWKLTVQIYEKFIYMSLSYSDSLELFSFFFLVVLWDVACWLLEAGWNWMKFNWTWSYFFASFCIKIYNYCSKGLLNFNGF